MVRGNQNHRSNKYFLPNPLPAGFVYPDMWVNCLRKSSSTGASAIQDEAQCFMHSLRMARRLQEQLSQRTL